MLNKVIFTLILMLSTATVWSQELPTEEIREAQIRLRAGVKSDRVMLRWAVDEPIAWQKANKIGFVLTRYTILRNGNLINKPEPVKLGTFQAKPLSAWENVVQDNDMAAVVAQSIYGESFEVDMGKGDELQESQSI